MDALCLCGHRRSYHVGTDASPHPKVCTHAVEAAAYSHPGVRPEEGYACPCGNFVEVSVGLARYGVPTKAASFYACKHALNALEQRLAEVTEVLPESGRIRAEHPLFIAAVKILHAVTLLKSASDNIRIGALVTASPVRAAQVLLAEVQEELVRRRSQDPK